MGKTTILVIDDEAIICDLLFRALTKLGYNVITATDGKEAIGIFEQQYDIINLAIIDLIMPGVDGIEVLGQLRLIQPDIPVIISSGKTDFDSEGIKEKIGAVVILIKPYSVHELDVAVKEALSISVS